MNYLKLIILTFIGCFAILLFAVGLVFVDKYWFSEPTIVHDTIYVNQSLSDWDLFTLATMKVESRFDPSAYNFETEAKGVLQITPIYIAEYNRLSCSSLADSVAYNPTQSLYLWEFINAYYNPEGDFEKAIYIHNPNAGAWYRNRIYSAMDDLMRYEKIRQQLVEFCYGY